MVYSYKIEMKFIDLIKINVYSPYQYHVLTKNSSLKFPLHNLLALYLGLYGIFANLLKQPALKIESHFQLSNTSKHNFADFVFQRTLCQDVFIL